MKTDERSQVEAPGALPGLSFLDRIVISPIVLALVTVSIGFGSAHCSGNAAYGPLLYIHFDSNASQQIDLEVSPSPHGLGDHPLAVIKGRDHCIRFTALGRSTSETLHSIIVGYPLRFDFLCVDYPKVPAGYESHFATYAPRTYRASGTTVNNGTVHPVVLGKQSRDNTITSPCAIRDYGTNNTLNTIASTNR